MLEIMESLLDGWRERNEYIDFNLIAHQNNLGNRSIKKGLFFADQFIKFKSLQSLYYLVELKSHMNGYDCMLKSIFL